MDDNNPNNNNNNNNARIAQGAGQRDGSAAAEGAPLCQNAQCVTQRNALRTDNDRLNAFVLELQEQLRTQTAEIRELNAEREKLRERLTPAGKHTERVRLARVH